MKKLVSLVLALLLALSFASVASAEGGEKINLVYWYAGNGMQRDTLLVNDRINELLAQIPGMENVTVTLMPTLGNEYQQKLVLAMTAEEQVDIVSTFGAFANITDEFRKGTFIALDDLMAEIPDTVAELPSWILDYGKVDGKQYYIPTYQQNGNQRLFTIPAEYLPYIADGTKEGIRKVLWEGTPDEKIDMIYDYVRALREAYPDKEIYTGSLASSFEQYGLAPEHDAIKVGSHRGFVVMADDHKVVEYYSTDFMKTAIKRTAEAYAEGLVPEDVLTIQDKDMIDKNMLNDRAYCWTDNQNVESEENMEAMLGESYGFPVVVVRMDPTYFVGFTYAAGGNAITSSCKNPEAAIKFIDLLCSKKGAEIYNTLVYGLEGVQYEKIDDTHIKTLEYDATQGSSADSYSAWKWNLGNTFNAWLNQACSDELNERIVNVVHGSEARFSDLIGFIPDTTAVENEVAQVLALQKEYYDGLIKGVMGEDWEAYFDEYCAKLEAAGCQKVIDTLQAQVDAFLAAK